MIVLLFVFAVIYAIGYIVFGVAEIPTQKLTAGYVDWDAAYATTGCTVRAPLPSLAFPSVP
jgi:hypothetical protein